MSTHAFFWLYSGRRGRMRNNKHFDDENDDIVMIIPGLEDEAPEDLTVQGEPGNLS
jgi:hypothetical protein